MSVLAVLDKCKLEDAEKELQAAEAELERVTADARKKVEALRELVKILTIRRDGKPKRVLNRKKKGEATAPSTNGDGEPDNRGKIIAYLQAAGPCTSGAISRGTGIAPHVVSRLCNSTPVIKCDPVKQTYELKRGV